MGPCRAIFHMQEAEYEYSQWAREQLPPIHATSQEPVARQSAYDPRPDDSASLSMMPNRLAVGRKRSGERQVLAKSRGWAVAALLPIGYTRTLLPAYEKLPDTDPLPFFGYSAVAGMNGRLYVAALKTDDPRKWHSRAFNRQKLEHLVHEKQETYPHNRIIGQHAHCALDYSCPTASNLFFGRWDMAIAVSPGCNSRCIGCISKHTEADLTSPT